DREAADGAVRGLESRLAEERARAVADVQRMRTELRVAEEARDRAVADAERFRAELELARPSVDELRALLAAVRHRT
ncbi:MAG: hypothetical protein QOG20_1372, partial [Pseudonocardiales bacterium]|nr:hypothetical protein [Pseudonocardiales bacterium]